MLKPIAISSLLKSLIVKLYIRRNGKVLRSCEVQAAHSNVKKKQKEKRFLKYHK